MRDSGDWASTAERNTNVRHARRCCSSWLAPCITLWTDQLIRTYLLTSKAQLTSKLQPIAHFRHANLFVISIKR